MMDGGINVHLYTVEPSTSYEHIPQPFIPDNSATTIAGVSAAVIAAIDSPNSTANDFNYIKVSNSTTLATSTFILLNNFTYSHFITTVSHAVLASTPSTKKLSMASFDLQPVLIEQDISSPINGGNKISEEIWGTILGPPAETTEGIGNDKLNSFYFYEVSNIHSYHTINKRCIYAFISIYVHKYNYIYMQNRLFRTVNTLPNHLYTVRSKLIFYNI